MMLVPRLDLRRITDPVPSEQRIQQELEQNQDQHESSAACFHTEFMAKVDEYSESWREAALKEQRTLQKWLQKFYLII